MTDITNDYAIKVLERKIKTMEDGALCSDWGEDKDIFRKCINSIKQVNELQNSTKVLEDTLLKVTTDKMILEEENKLFKEFAATVPEAWARFQDTLREHTEQTREER